MKNVVKAYLKDVCANLVCVRSVKSAFKKQLGSEIEAYASDKETLTADLLCAEFGSPKEVAAGLATRHDYEMLLKKAKRSKIIWMCTAIASLLLSVFLFWFTCVLINDNGGTITIIGPVEVQESPTNPDGFSEKPEG